MSGRWNHLLKHLEIDGRIDYTKIQPYDFSEKQVYDYYQIKIHVEHNDKEPFAHFVIEDNGTGISKEDVEGRIINTGIHNDLHDDILNEMPEWLKPTSAFGIGLHSVFAVADTLFVHTRTEFDKTVYNINMHSGKRDGYIFMSISEHQDFRFCNCSHGTRMKFAVNVSNCDNSEKMDIQNDHDPLAERPESNFCRRLQNMLKSMLHTSLFHFTYKFNSDNEITYNKLYEDRCMGLLFKENRRNNIFGKKHNSDYYDFALDMSGEHIVLWDKQRAVSMVYSLKESENRSCWVFCKGFIVENAKIFCNGYKMMPDIVDYWGGDTKSILNISRDKLSQEQIENNKVIFSQARAYMSEVYYSVLSFLLEDNGIKEWHEDISEFMKCWLLKKVDDVDVPSLSENITVLLGKYNIPMYSEDDIKCLILRHGFCLLLKSYKEQIQDILNSLDERDRIKYVINFEVLDGDNDKNKIIEEQTYFLEFVDEALKLYDDKDEQMYILELFIAIFKAEFADIFINYSKHDLYSIDEHYLSSFGDRFGEIYTSVFVGQLAQSLRKKIQNNIKYSDLEDVGYNVTPLDVYLSVPLTNIVYLLICTNKKFFPLKTALTSELSYIPGYDNSYGFLGVNSVEDIIMSSQLRIEEEKYNETLAKYFPFIRQLSCKEISVNTDGKMILQFDNIYENKGVIQYLDNSFTKLLYSHSHMKQVPVPVGYEDIAVNQVAALSVGSKGYNEELWLYGNYITYLWDDFINISKQYGSRIAEGEAKETIINEVMPKSRTDNKPTLNLLRYIYHNKVYNNDLGFEEAWRKIYETYRRFVAMVLDCISI